MFTLAALAIAAVVVIAVLGAVLSLVFALVGLPFAILFGLLPWALRIAGVVLIIKAIGQKPVKWENFLPGVAAFVLAWVVGWIF